MTDQLEKTGSIGKPEKQVAPNPPEVKVSEMFGRSEQEIVDRIEEGGDTDKVLEDIAKGQDQDEIRKTPLDQFLDDAALDDETLIVGGELISPTAIREGETSNRPAQERGWLSAITNATHGKEDSSVKDRQNNVQEIIDAALKAGVPKDLVGAHLQSLGINIVPREQAVIAPKTTSEPIEEKSAVQPEPQNEDTEQQRHLTQERILELKKEAYEKAREYQQEEDSSFLTSEVNTPTDLKTERSQLPDEVGRRFHAHGIAKSKQLESLLNLLDNGVDTSKPFHTIDLFRLDEDEIAGAMGAAGPYDTGGFIVLGEPKKADQPIEENDIKDTGIAAVLVNREWYEAIPDLEEAYPEVRFIRADHMNEELTNWVKEVDEN